MTTFIDPKTPEDNFFLTLEPERCAEIANTMAHCLGQMFVASRANEFVFAVGKKVKLARLLPEGGVAFFDVPDHHEV